MAVTLTSTLNIQLDALLQNTVGLAALQSTISRGQRTSLASGVGANQADKVFSESAKSLSGNYDVDLAGVLVDAFGTTITFARIKAIIVIADPTNTGSIVVGGAAANQFFGPFGASTHTTNVRAGGALVLFAPDATAWPVTAATADILRFAPSAGTQLMDWAVIGASA